MKAGIEYTGIDGFCLLVYFLIFFSLFVLFYLSFYVFFVFFSFSFYMFMSLCYAALEEIRSLMISTMYITILYNKNTSLLNCEQSIFDA